MLTPSVPVLCGGQAFIRSTIMENIALIGIDLGK
ncbi:IS110 family transposase, partial [Enterobacter hormaechei subsp. xiangfangensis]